MKKIISLLCLLLSFKVFAYNFFESFPVLSQSISGKQYPQNDLYRYSGTGKKRLPLKDAVSAMLATKPIFFSSNTFVDIAACFMKKKACKKDIINYWDIYISHLSDARRQYIVNLINLKKSENNGPYSSWDEATLVSKEIIDQYFTWLGYNNIYKNFVKFRSTINGETVSVANTDGIAWPSETIYTSTLSYVAALYGPRTVIVKEKNPRSLDLGYWNFLNSGYWYGTARDMGEFIAAGYIEGKDIVGYQVRKVTGGSFKPSKTKFGKRWQPEWHAIDFAFYLEKTSEGPVVVILRGEDHGCIQRVSTFKYSFCTDQVQSLIKPKKLKKAKDNPEKLAYLAKEIRKDPTRLPRRTYGVPTVVGIFKLSTNQVPQEFYNYRRMGRLTKSERKWLVKKVIKHVSGVELVER